MLKLLVFIAYLTFVSASELDELKRKIQEMESLLKQVLYQNAELQSRLEGQNYQILQRIDSLERKSSFGKTTPYNVTIEELEIRVERLEEDMFEAQTEIVNNRADITGNQGDIITLEFSLQETIETVMDHTDNLNALDEAVENLENRTTATEQDVLALEDQLGGLEVRTTDIEQIHLETKDSAFFATLTSNIIFEDTYQIIPFDDDKINKGGHYNTTTGTYTAPVAGIYQFFAYIRATPRANLHFYIDGARYARPLEDYSENVSEADGGTIAVSLTAGQVVEARTGAVNYTVTGDGISSWFGGFLVFPDSA